MHRSIWLQILLCTTLLVGALTDPARAQSGPSDLRIFGYFQPAFVHQNGPEGDGAYNSFSLQQLNIFFQKDVGKNLSSFVNIEAVNSFSTRDGWGSMRIEEAWVRYRRSRALNVKVGLQIPVFNNFNEIKNRMPLIPYVIRPLVYESSLSRQLNNPLYVPQQAFVQTYGWAPLGKGWKLDYAAYLGNTDHVVASFGPEPVDTRTIDVATGVDTSSAFLFGWRLGTRKGDLKFGFSGTVDRTNLFAGASQLPFVPEGDYGSVPRYRSGFDLSFRLGKWWFEHESIGVVTNADEQVDAQVGFTYLIIGRDFTDRFEGYIGYQIINQRIEVVDELEETDIWLPTIGVAWSLEEQITLKTQYAYVVVDVHNNPESQPDPKFHHFSVAVSVSF
jgi:hypothetical protein